MFAMIHKFVGDLFTGPDGETWALGRVYSLPVLATGLAVPLYALHKGQAVSLSELAVLLPAVAGGVGAMVAITNHIDTPGAGMFPGSQLEKPRHG